MPLDCLICERIQSIRKNENPYFVKELNSGYVALGDFQYYKGYTLFLFKQHVTELYDIPLKLRSVFLMEMSKVAEAVHKAFSPKKMNYELLGNKCEHMHWHLFPRYESDPNKDQPIWMTDKNIRNSTEYVPSASQLQEYRLNLLKYL